MYYGDDGEKKLTHDIVEAANKCGYTLIKKSRKNKNVTQYIKSIDMYCPRYFKYDDRTTQIFEDGLKEGVKISFFKK